jgi:ATP synthase protein I
MSINRDSERLAKEIGRRGERKMEARKRKDRGIWFGLGMFGIVGWSVAIPTIASLAIGIWIDSRLESGMSWTLMLLGAGIVMGCLNAWYWVKKESGGE